jgi:hypothetical protein
MQHGNDGGRTVVARISRWFGLGREAKNSNELQIRVYDIKVRLKTGYLGKDEFSPGALRKFESLSERLSARDFL